MEQKNLYLIEGAEAFSKGEFENTALENGCLVLEPSSGGRVYNGCYTTKPLQMVAFQQMVVSWNCDTPVGTSVEIQGRVLVDGQWSKWMSFGRWSPFLCRKSQKEEGALAKIDADVLTVANGKSSKNVQLRVYLYTDCVEIGPQVRLLGVSVLPLDWKRQEGRQILRELYLPAYSQLNRNPMIGHSISSPVTISMLINRWGEDVLPEEVAHLCYDHGYNGFNNWSFAVAAAGCFGYRAYVAYLDLQGLRQQIYDGYGVGVCVSYTNDEEQKETLPYLEGAPTTAENHLIALRGFCMEKDREYVLVNDCYAANDNMAPRKYPLDQFLKAWNGVAYVVHRKQKGAGFAAPQRIGARLRATEKIGEYIFEVKGKEYLLPQDFLGTAENPSGTLAFTIQNNIAYATTAHKEFRYMKVNEQGGFQLPSTAMESQGRVTIYAIDDKGKMMIAERKS